MKKLTILLSLLLIPSLFFAQKKQKLFDGKSLSAWHTYQKTDASGWAIEGKVLTTDGHSNDLVSNQDFGDFDLSFEFKVNLKGNSGVIYKVIEDKENPTYYSGAEYQLIDDTGYPPYNDNGKMVYINDKQKTGANYDMQAPIDFAATNPAGQWNKGRIIVKNDHIQHFVNGRLVVEYHYGSDTWKQQLANSKFKTWPYAIPHHKGKIALQGHGDPVWFKNITIKRL
jgi:Domain of Unknown Function (DUF1080)